MSDYTLSTTVRQPYAAAVLDDDTTIIEAFDPGAMVSMGGDHAEGSPLATVATDARERLTAMLAALS